MCDPRFMAQPPMMPSSAAPETPLRPQRGPVHMDDGETPPPVCPFWTQAAETFVPASGPTLGAVSEECERGTKLTYEERICTPADHPKGTDDAYDPAAYLSSPLQSIVRDPNALPGLGGGNTFAHQLDVKSRLRGGSHRAGLGGTLPRTVQDATLFEAQAVELKGSRPMTEASFGALKKSADALKSTHLRDLLKDEARCDAMMVEAEGICLDYCRQKVTQECMTQLFDLAKAAGVEEKKKALFAGEKINQTEGRAVLHEVINVDGKNVVPEVHSVLDAIKAFSEKVRSGSFVGHTGKTLTDVLCIGIGGSYLGVEFVHEALRSSLGV
eukprot:g30011.t1